jgi:hypothetical protein
MMCGKVKDEKYVWWSLSIMVMHSCVYCTSKNRKMKYKNEHRVGGWRATDEIKAARVW